MLTQAELLKILHYDPESGHFTWLVAPTTGRVRVGARAGHTMSSGYRRIVYKGRGYLEHRLVFLYVEGSFPPWSVDHINRDRGDNRRTNLRHASKLESAQNRSRARLAKSGHKGVYISKRGYITGSVKYNRVKYYLGIFKTVDEAAKAVRKLRESLSGKFCCHR